MEEIEKVIILKTWNEGIGSVYERLMLYRFFLKLNEKYKFKSVLEYNCPITKGYDNLAFMGKSFVTIADSNIELIKNNWKFENLPVFSSFDKLEKYDLVWNFAIVQLQPNVIKEMLNFTNKYILIFVPNVLNFGAPIHFLYHFITRQKCNHAERGKFFVRTKRGLMRLAKSYGINILKCDYIDMPILPDIGFSRKELKQLFGIKEKKKDDIPNFDDSLFKKIGFLERMNLPDFIKTVISHHIYLFGEKLNER
jgi:hypothetical protein